MKTNGEPLLKTTCIPPKQKNYIYEPINEKINGITNQLFNDANGVCVPVFCGKNYRGLFAHAFPPQIGGSESYVFKPSVGSAHGIGDVIHKIDDLGYIGFIRFPKSTPRDKTFEYVFAKNEENLIKCINRLIEVMTLYKKETRLVGDISRACPIDSVILPKELKEDIVGDFEKFMSNKKIYYNMNIPWKRGYLFCGEPGNGKSLMINALCRNYPNVIYTDMEDFIEEGRLDLSTLTRSPDSRVGFDDESDSSIMQDLSIEAQKDEMFINNICGTEKVKTNSVKLSEELSKIMGVSAIDSSMQRNTNYALNLAQAVDDKLREGDNRVIHVIIMEDLEKKIGLNDKDHSILTLSNFLNELDGAAKNLDGVIFIGTTNDQVELADSIIGRPGRFDRVWVFKSPTPTLILEFFKNRNFTISGGSLDQEYANQLSKFKASMAFVEDFVVTCKLQEISNNVSEKTAAMVLSKIREHKKLKKELSEGVDRERAGFEY
jgi:hypothetical protein